MKNPLFRKSHFQCVSRWHHKLTLVACFKRWISREQDKILKTWRRLDGLFSNGIWLRLKADDTALLRISFAFPPIFLKIMNNEFGIYARRLTVHIWSHFCIAHVVLRIRLTSSEDGGGDCHSFLTTRVSIRRHQKMLVVYGTPELL